MPSAISRGPITNRILSELATAGFPVGDNTTPIDAFGWQGQPNETDSVFIPYMTCAALTGQVQRVQGMGDTGTEWSLPYSVFYAGVTRKQTEALADRLRSALTNIEREDVETDTGRWQIQKISCTSVGGSVKQGSAFPDYFTQVDSFDVWVSKRRG